MTVSYPYSLAQFADRLEVLSVTWDIQRNDELSGTGGGRVWAAELAPPLWVGSVTLREMRNSDAKQIAALIRKLHGSQEALFLYDPLSKYPQRDPKGLAIAQSTVRISSISADRANLSLNGLPLNYVLLPGDKMQIAYGASPTRYAFIEVSEPTQANSSGVTPVFGVFPHIPNGVAVGTTVVLSKPACRCIILPGSHNPGTASALDTEGQSFKVIQKK